MRPIGRGIAMRGAGYARLRRAERRCGAGDMRACGAREGQSADGREAERGAESGERAERERRQSGGRGADRAADYREKMLRRGMNPDAFHFYLDTFKNGMPPHGGFAIGLERITACFLGIANVKECSMFPRDINRVAP